MLGLAVSDVMTAKFEGSSFQHQIIKSFMTKLKLFLQRKEKSFHKTIISGYGELSVLIKKSLNAIGISNLSQSVSTKKVQVFRLTIIQNLHFFSLADAFWKNGKIHKANIAFKNIYKVIQQNASWEPNLYSYQYTVTFTVSLGNNKAKRTLIIASEP